MFIVKTTDKQTRVTHVFTTEEYSIFPSEEASDQFDARFERVGGKDSALCFRLDHKRQNFFIMNADGKTIDRI